MKISVDISLYPLQENYLHTIDAFIKSLYKYPSIRVKTHHLSTMIIGDFDEVMHALQTEIKETFTQEEQASFVLKVLKGDVVDNVNLDSYH